ncbi:MAG: mechanosensitive ion channel, partial [Paludibacteraceae bacterium]|nr:mechanosensitive ion channel [Paludibacteraceae bacterium]
ELGKSILIAILIYFIGRYLIKLVDKMLVKVMTRRKFLPEVQTFLSSVVHIALTILLVISIVGALGVETTSFAALLASAGVAIGMALSGQLQNFAGGVIILLLRPYKIGDYVEAGGVAGTVKAIQIFNTVLTTPDNKIITVPNGSISNGVLVNYSQMDTRRVDWTFGVEYGSDVEKVKACVNRILAADTRVLKDPAVFIALGALADSSVNLTVRAWVNSGDYWDVFFDVNQKVYEQFKAEGNEYPFPQLTVHQAK